MRGKEVVISSTAVAATSVTSPTVCWGTRADGARLRSRTRRAHSAPDDAYNHGSHNNYCHHRTCYQCDAADDGVGYDGLNLQRDSSLGAAHCTLLSPLLIATVSPEPIPNSKHKTSRKPFLTHKKIMVDRNGGSFASIERRHITVSLLN